MRYLKLLISVILVFYSSVHGMERVQSQTDTRFDFTYNNKSYSISSDEMHDWCRIFGSNDGTSLSWHQLQEIAMYIDGYGTIFKPYTPSPFFPESSWPESKTEPYRHKRRDVPTVPKSKSIDPEISKARIYQQFGRIRDIQAQVVRLMNAVRTQWFTGYEQKLVKKLQAILADRVTNLLQGIQHGPLYHAERSFQELIKMYPWNIAAKGYAQTNQEAHDLKHAIHKYHFNVYEHALTVIKERRYTEFKLQNQKSLFHVDVSQKIFTALTTAKTKNELCDSIAQTTDMVVTQAEQAQYEIPSEILMEIDQYQDSIQSTETTEDILINLGSLDQVLTGMQIQIAGNLDKKIVQPSISLAEGAIVFLKTLDPRNNKRSDIELCFSLGKYLADVTMGQYYLSPQEYSTRVEQFWKDLNSLSKTTAQEKFNIIMKAAARIIRASSPLVVIKILKEIEVAKGLYDFAVDVANHMQQHVDTCFQEVPAVITAEGELLWMASKEQAAQTSWLGWFQDKLQSKKEKKVLKDSASVLEKEEAIQEADEILHNKVQEQLKQLLTDGNKIKGFAKTKIFKPEHIFSDKHVNRGIMKLGNNKESIVQKIIDVIKIADRGNHLRDRLTRIWTKINNVEVEIHVFVQKDKLVGFDGFVGYSARQNPKPVKIPYE